MTERGPAGSKAGEAGGSVIARARLVVDLAAIVANWHALDALSAPGVETAAVVKADAYGLGLAPVAQALARSGVRSFFVAIAEEGAALRSAVGPAPSIYVFSGFMPGDAALCRDYRLVPCLNDLGQIEAFARALPGAPAAVQLDTGMNRLGMAPGELARAAPLIEALRPVLAISHLACADEPGRAENRAQEELFRLGLAALPRMRASLAATAGILLGPDWHFSMTRPGIGLYGGLPFAAARPVVTLALPVVQVREIARGEAVGYGGAWIARRPSRIATLSAGYADGLIRAIGDGRVTLGAEGAACPLVGRVSMDLVTADVTDLPTVPPALTILDADRGIDPLAAAGGTIGYEMLTALGARYERVYLGGAEPRAT